MYGTGAAECIPRYAALYTALAKIGTRHGYEIIKEIATVTGKEPSTSHIYPFLNKLADQGYVDIEETGDRGKKVYVLTESGHEFVDEHIDAFGKMLHAAIEDRITACGHCNCEIYDNGFEKDGKMYCCKLCANATSE